MDAGGFLSMCMLILILILDFWLFGIARGTETSNAGHVIAECGDRALLLYGMCARSSASPGTAGPTFVPRNARERVTWRSSLRKSIGDGAEDAEEKSHGERMGRDGLLWEYCVVVQSARGSRSIQRRAARRNEARRGISRTD